MDNKNKRYKELEEDLKSEDSKYLISTILKLREGSAIRGSIAQLRDLYERNENESVRDEIERFLNDLKQQKMVTEVIEAIESAQSDLTRQKLISSCWQSGLDYSVHLNSFVDYSIRYSFLATLECFSVIEEWVHKSSTEERAGWKSRLQESINEFDSEKRKLIEAIISLL